MDRIYKLYHLHSENGKDYYFLNTLIRYVIEDHLSSLKEILLNFFKKFVYKPLVDLFYLCDFHLLILAYPLHSLVVLHEGSRRFSSLRLSSSISLILKY